MTVYAPVNMPLINTTLRLMKLLYIVLPYYLLLTDGRPILITTRRPYKES